MEIRDTPLPTWTVPLEDPVNGESLPPLEVISTKKSNRKNKHPSAMANSTSSATRGPMPLSNAIIGE